MTVSTLNPTATALLPICIAGEWRLGTGERYVTRYPATGEVVAELNAASVADVEEAVAGAAGHSVSRMSVRLCCTAWPS
jgi:acyl-CoA reductase-like NAD-dependent aldehyde dehydrogenase